VTGSSGVSSRSGAVVSKLWKRHEALEAVEGSLEEIRGSRGGRSLRRQQARSPEDGRKVWLRQEGLEAAARSGGSGKVWRQRQGLEAPARSGGVCHPSHTRHLSAAACDSPPAPARYSPPASIHLQLHLLPAIHLLPPIELHLLPAIQLLPVIHFLSPSTTASCP